MKTYLLSIGIIISFLEVCQSASAIAFKFELDPPNSLGCCLPTADDIVTTTAGNPYIGTDAEGNLITVPQPGICFAFQNPRSLVFNPDH